MLPAGNGGSTRRMTSAKRKDAGKRSATRPILAEAVEQNWRNKSHGSCGTPLTDSGGGGGGGDVNRRRGSNEDIRRTASIGRGGGDLSGTGDRTAEMIWTEDHASGTGGSSPTDDVELPLSKAGGGGVRLTAVAEVHRPPSTDDEGEILAQPSGQQVVGNTDPGKAPVMLSAPRGDTLFNKPEMHSAQMKVLDGIPMEEVECLEPLLTSVPDAPLDSKPMVGNMIRNSSDLAVPQKD